MKSQIKILLLTFVIAIVLIYVAPNAESAMILITAFWGFIYLNNALYDYKKRSEDENAKIHNSTQHDTSPPAEYFNNSELDDRERFLLPPEFYNENFESKVTPDEDKLLEEQSNKVDENSVKEYDSNLEFTPDKIGYMRHDMEKRTHQNEAYSRCYKPLKGETNDCDLYEWQPIDERMSDYWRQVGYRDKKAKDGYTAKAADYFRAHFNTELDREEKKVWWETENIY